MYVMYIRSYIAMYSVAIIKLVSYYYCTALFALMIKTHGIDLYKLYG